MIIVTFLLFLIQSNWDKAVIPTIVFLSIMLLVLIYMNNKKILRHRNFKNQSSYRTTVLRELVTNIEDVKKEKMEYLFDNQLHNTRKKEVRILGQYITLLNWFSFIWEFTFYFGSALLIFSDF